LYINIKKIILGDATLMDVGWRFLTDVMKMLLPLKIKVPGITAGGKAKK
jgi:hypothetical protein